MEGYWGISWDPGNCWITRETLGNSLVGIHKLSSWRAVNNSPSMHLTSKFQFLGKTSCLPNLGHISTSMLRRHDLSASYVYRYFATVPPLCYAGGRGVTVSCVAALRDICCVLLLGCLSPHVQWQKCLQPIQSSHSSTTPILAIFLSPKAHPADGRSILGLIFF